MSVASSVLGRARHRERGVALLMAMVWVTLVAVLAAGVGWRQWQAVEVETAERHRVQAAWILHGALDWARLILREDARTNQNEGQPDHLGEPWAMPLEEARLGSFLAAEASQGGEALLDAFLSGRIVDLQSRLNVGNLIRMGMVDGRVRAVVSEPDARAFARLFQHLGLPASELERGLTQLLQAHEAAVQNPQPTDVALRPSRFDQLGWIGWSAATLDALAPFVTVLPERTPVNLNTAPPEVLLAAVPGLDLTEARRVVTQRAQTPFRSLADANEAMRLPGAGLEDQAHAVRSRYFEVQGQVRIEGMPVGERSLVVRNGLAVTVLWRERRTGLFPRASS